MANGIIMSGATSANIQILQSANAAFQVAQKRVSTGKMVFGAADDTTRYRMSETMLGRQRQVDDVNNNISLALKTLEATDRSMSQIIGLVEAGQNLIRKAQAEGASGARSTQTTANIGSATLIAGTTAGTTYRFSITSDSGQNFTYSFTATNPATVTWGQVADALNAANIGVQAEFVPSTTAGQTNIRFTSTNGRDFRFDGISDQVIMDDLDGLTSPSTGTAALTAANANNFFGAGGTATATETGFTVGFGGAAVGTKTTATFTTAGSLLVFKDGNGQVQTYRPSVAAIDIPSMVAEFNARFATTGVIAEFVNQTGAGTRQLRIRNAMGGNMELITGTGDFATGAANIGLTVPSTAFATPLSTNNTLRLQYGVQFDAIITNINAMITNNPVQNGRNLLTGQGMNVVMDEFAGNPITITGVNLSGAGSTNTALSFSAAVAGNTWTTDLAIQNAALAANNALINLRDYQARFATFNTYMKERYDLNKTLSADLKTQGDELVAADMAEESANMTALQTRQQFAVQAFSMASQTEQGLLRLLG